MRQPAEWMPHDAVWIGFPSHPELWEEDLGPAREEVVAFARAVHADGRGERVILVAADETSALEARRLAGVAAEVQVQPFGHFAHVAAVPAADRPKTRAKKTLRRR